MTAAPHQPDPRTAFRWEPLVLAAPLALVALVMAVVGGTAGWAWRPQRVDAVAASLFDAWFGVLREPGVTDLLIGSNYGAVMRAHGIAATCAAVVLAACFVTAIVRRPIGLRSLRFGYGVGYLVCVVFAAALWQLSGLLEAPPEHVAAIGYFGERGTYLPRFWWWYDLAWPALLAVPVIGLCHIASHRAAVLRLYTGDAPSPAPGDRLIEDVRTHGRDPRYRKSWLTSAAGHFAAIVLIPWLLTWIGCADRYHVPQGGGEPMVALVRVVQPQPVERQTFIVNPRSAISFYVPKLEDSRIEEQVDRATELEYQATMAAAGAMGADGGKRGGWPDGMGRHPVRFIRLRDHGPGWDDGMDDQSRADLNFLDAFSQLTGFPVAEESEAKTIRQLSRFEPGFAPPFVYMTGEGHVRISRDDTDRLRDYLLSGGMLFADAGHPNFHRAFTQYVTRELLPDHRLIPIADDDPIFQMPYAFPNGAPPLWHHGGRKAMGVKAKVNGRQRWVVFYHPGDINDAWKTGRSGLDRDTAEGAVHMGVNIIYYAFTHYLEDTRKHRE